MEKNTLTAIGVSLACALAGGSLSNFAVHLSYSHHFDRLPERFKKSRMTAYMSTHMGNVFMALGGLGLGLFLLGLVKYEIGLNPETLFVFLGFCAPALKNAWMIDRREKAGG